MDTLYIIYLWAQKHFLSLLQLPTTYLKIEIQEIT